MRSKVTYKSLLPIMLALALVVGCSSSGTTNSSSSSKSVGNEKGIPNWVLDPGSSFSESQYLMATGSGSTLKEAESDAFSRLSQIFQMDINSMEQVITESTLRSVNNNFYSESTEQLLNNIQIGSNQKLMNTSILASDVDQMGTYHALAGMDRAESSRIYQQEIANNIITIQEYESNAANESSTLPKLIIYKKALASASANVILSRQLNIIRGGSAANSESTQTLSRIEESFRKVQQEALVAIVSDNTTESISAAIAEVFQNSGFTITGNPEDAVLVARVNYQTQKANLNRDDSEFVKWELIIDVANPESDQSFNTFMVEGRDGAISYSDALKRADYTARAKVEKDFNTFLNEQLLSTH